MTTADVALITERRYERPAHVDDYVGNILREDAILTEALAAQGLTAARVDWSRPDVDWGAFRCLLLRTPWDYFDRLDEFSAWLDGLEGRVPVLNELGTVRWNLDKHYLAELSRRGVPIPPTLFLERGRPVDLAERLAHAGWPQAVLKPAVSGAARHTYRVDRDRAALHQPLLDELVAREAMMLQPFLPDVVARGEVTVVVIDGTCTHAVLKVAKPGDFRVQDDHGGTVHPHAPSPDELELARAAMATISPPPRSARADI
ncbi:MAG: hypothetical protein KDK70_41495, partial [Myxococcales bacterium]|nr:hypothetical protein [Myxococcales bacterium]